MASRVLFSLLGVAVTMAGTVLAGEPDDPHLWLEEVTGDRALSWVRERNAESVAELTKSDAFEALDRRILSILDSDAKIPFVSKLGPYYYNFWKDAKHKRRLWRRTTLEEYRKDEPRWEVVIDLDALGAAEGENWVWHGADPLQPGYERFLISLSRGGADADVTREFDVTTKSFLPGGFALPEAKSRISWRGIDSVFVGTNFGPGSLTNSGYPRIVKEWTRGTPLDRAAVVFECQPEEMSVSAYRDLTPGFERDFVARSMTFFTNELYLRRDGKLIKIEKPDDARCRVERELMYVVPRTDWAVGGKTYPAGSLIAADFEGFLRGDRTFDVLFEPAERKSLASFGVTRHHVLLNELDNIRSRLFILTHKDGRWAREPLPGAPEIGTAAVTAVDPDESDDYFLTASNYLMPTTLAFGTVGGPAPEKLKQGPTFFDAKGLAVEQHEATSADGTKIPYFEIARDGLKLDGSNPTLLYGYGGFEIAMTPAYNSTAGVGWLEKGGVYVVANIRGGGEFGPKWHKAALKANRPRAYEDFAAVAEDLIRPPRHPGREQWRPLGRQHAHPPPRPLRRRRLSGPPARHAPLPYAPGRRELDGRVRQPRPARGVGVHPRLLPVPQPQGRREVSPDPLHHLDPRRPRPPRPRPQDGREDEGDEPRPPLLREHRGRPRRRRRQQAGGVHVGPGVYFPLESVEVGFTLLART